jgi:hypothetical protein
MEKELNEFKIEVLTQLAVINSKLDGYGKTQEVAVQADNRSKQNEQDIKDMKDTNKWAFRTSVGAIITSAIGIVFLLIKLGAGIH